ncbi:SGNH/GDSL hydrolase family protein [Dyadobacter bucti]|uniref:SGNH/GDSL hydrolase family protein n=1 Tax=Dyadobacter bucti TaxID=2572203 RepID=UPI001108B69C|nr:SGNH/GDSL hydrolase family protein [Dyadobacter bucti]
MKQRTHYALLLAFIAIILISSSLYAQQVDLGSIQKQRPIRYVAIGGSLSAGVRDGGLTRESQISSFPNLLAKQMGLLNFKQPLFDSTFRNGIGYQKVENHNGILKFTHISENTLSEKNLSRIEGVVDNLAIPFLKISNIRVDESMRGSFLPAFERNSYDHIYRYVDQQREGKASYYWLVNNKIDTADFFTLEIGMHDFVSYYKNGGYGQSISMMTNDREGYYPEDDLIQLLFSKGAKGVIANVPDVLRFPYFQHYKLSDIKKISGDQLFAEFNGKLQVRRLNKNDLLIPTENTSTLFTNVSSIGRSPDVPLMDEDVIGAEEKVDVGVYNSWITTIAILNRMPVVDLNGLYSKILDEDFVTDDGVKIDPSYPNGNFFSADGIHPTKIGQAVIANEFIKTINSYYGVQIPLINIKEIK